jgi:hypothetical protein
MWGYASPWSFSGVGAQQNWQKWLLLKPLARGKERRTPRVFFNTRRSSLSISVVDMRPKKEAFHNT